MNMSEMCTLQGVSPAEPALSVPCLRYCCGRGVCVSCGDKDGGSSSINSKYSITNFARSDNNRFDDRGSGNPASASCSRRCSTVDCSPCRQRRRFTKAGHKYSRLRCFKCREDFLLQQSRRRRGSSRTCRPQACGYSHCSRRQSISRIRRCNVCNSSISCTCKSSTGTCRSNNGRMRRKDNHSSANSEGDSTRSSESSCCRSSETSVHSSTHRLPAHTPTKRAALRAAVRTWKPGCHGAGGCRKAPEGGVTGFLRGLSVLKGALGLPALFGRWLSKADPEGDDASGAAGTARQQPSRAAATKRKNLSALRTAGGVAAAFRCVAERALPDSRSAAIGGTACVVPLLVLLLTLPPAASQGLQHTPWTGNCPWFGCTLFPPPSGSNSSWLQEHARAAAVLHETLLPSAALCGELCNNLFVSSPSTPSANSSSGSLLSLFMRGSSSASDAFSPFSSSPSPSCGGFEYNSATHRCTLFWSLPSVLAPGSSAISAAPAGVGGTVASAATSSAASHVGSAAQEGGGHTLFPAAPVVVCGLSPVRTIGSTCTTSCLVSEWSPWSNCVLLGSKGRDGSTYDGWWGLQRRTRAIRRPPWGGGDVCPSLEQVRPCSVSSSRAHGSHWEDSISGDRTTSRSSGDTSNSNYSRSRDPGCAMTGVGIFGWGCDASLPFHRSGMDWHFVLSLKECQGLCRSDAGCTYFSLDQRVASSAAVAGTALLHAASTSSASGIAAEDEQQELQLDRSAMWTSAFAPWFSGSDSRWRGGTPPVAAASPTTSLMTCYLVRGEEPGCMFFSEHFISAAREGGIDRCPVDCVAGEWGPWTPCSNVCSHAEQQFRFREVLLREQHGGRPCVLSEHRSCFRSPMYPKAACPTGGGGVLHECQYTPWSPWSACSSPCEGGVQQRVRSLLFPAAADIACDAALFVQRSCNDGIPCPQQQGCEISFFSAWSPCSSSCHTGQRYRTRQVRQQQQQQQSRTSAASAAGEEANAALPLACLGHPTIQMETCNEEIPCNSNGAAEGAAAPATGEGDCTLSPWEEWTACMPSQRLGGSGTSSRGQRMRWRAKIQRPTAHPRVPPYVQRQLRLQQQHPEQQQLACVSPDESLVEVEACEMPPGSGPLLGPGEDDCVLGPWSAWSDCYSSSSGRTCAATDRETMGWRSRVRPVLRPALPHDLLLRSPCAATAQYELCAVPRCPFLYPAAAGATALEQQLVSYAQQQALPNTRAQQNVLPVDPQEWRRRRSAAGLPFNSSGGSQGSTNSGADSESVCSVVTPPSHADVYAVLRAILFSVLLTLTVVLLFIFFRKKGLQEERKRYVFPLDRGITSTELSRGDESEASFLLHNGAAADAGAAEENHRAAEQPQGTEGSAEDTHVEVVAQDTSFWAESDEEEAQGAGVATALSASSSAVAAPSALAAVVPRAPASAAQPPSTTAAALPGAAPSLSSAAPAPAGGASPGAGGASPGAAGAAFLTPPPGPRSASSTAASPQVPPAGQQQAAVKQQQRLAQQQH